VPVVQTFGSFGADLRDRERPHDDALANRIRLEVALARSVAHTIARSADEAAALARMGVARERIALIPPGIDTGRFTPSGPVADRTDVPRLVAVGALQPASGFATAIAALRRLPEVELVILGDPPADRRHAADEVARLRAGARQFDVLERVTFLDEVDQEALPALLRSADAVVSAPWHGPVDAGPVLAATACGVPVVATAVGAVADVVVDGVTGVHVAPRRPDQLATAIRGLLGDPVRRLGFGVAGTDRARSRYEWARIAADTERVYATLLPVDRSAELAVAAELPDGDQLIEASDQTP
jgi:D-inositol-3-phosphate glycosyltransferase